MKNWLRQNKDSLPIGILCLALLILFIFQITWLNNSRNLIEEQFDQKVNLAMGSALSDFNASHQTDLDLQDLQACGDGETLACLPLVEGKISNEDQGELKESLNAHMTYFGINEKYQVDIFDNSCIPAEEAYCCEINADPSSDLSYNLGVSFPSRDKYLFDKMKFMIISSILIFIILSSVSFFMIRGFIKQKKITSNNIDFFNNTAHELKTPLTNIKLAMNLLGKKHPGITDDKYVDIIKTESGKLSGQIERVLFLSRMESGDHNLKKEVLSINNILTEVVDNMSLRIKEKMGEVNLDLPTKNINILGDYYHISNVFSNLLDNAIKYCNNSPQIKISVMEKNDHVRVIFSDNGIGISKSDQEHIFEKFQRVNTGDVREAKGFGIGLSYVKKVIELHRGFIRVQSELNKGSRFELILPNT